MKARIEQLTRTKEDEDRKTWEYLTRAQWFSFGLAAACVAAIVNGFDFYTQAAIVSALAGVVFGAWKREHAPKRYLKFEPYTEPRGSRAKTEA